jgi:hypothetical protein
MSDKHTYRWIPLPPNFATTVVDATVAEIASFRRQSPWTVWKKIREGHYKAFKDGRITKIDVASVIADRDRTIAESKNPFGKRRPGGQPRKPRPEEEQVPPAEPQAPPAEPTMGRRRPSRPEAAE